MPDLTIGLPLTVSSNNELFLAICKFGLHTFITVGVQDKESKKNFALFTIGQGKVENSDRCSSMYKQMFHSLDSALRHESWLYYVQETKTISYKAFKLTTEQYLALLAYVPPHLSLWNGEESRDAFAYIPEASTVDGSQSFAYQVIKPLDKGLAAENRKKIEPSSPFATLTLDKTCRHGGIKILNDILGGNNHDFSNNIAPNFASSLPYSNDIIRGKFLDQVFILPLPPIAAGHDEKQYKILLRLYLRLEQIPKLKPNDPRTLNKFNAVKDLYEKISATVATDSIAGMLQKIVSWEETNKGTIEQQRRFNFFSSTTTSQTIDEIKNLAAENKF